MALSDRVRKATELVSGQTGAAPAALVMLSQSLRGGSMDDLRRVVGLTPSGAVRLVDRLVAEGLVERRAGADRRSLALVLTRAGRAVARRISMTRADAVAEVLGQLAVDDRASLELLAERLVAALVVERLADRASGEEPAAGWLCRLCDQKACGRPEGRCPAAAAAGRLVPS